MSCFTLVICCFSEASEKFTEWENLDLILVDNLNEYKNLGGDNLSRLTNEAALEMTKCHDRITNWMWLQ